MMHNPGPAFGGVGPNWEQFQLAKVPSQHTPKSVELGARPNWEQLAQGQPWHNLYHFYQIVLTINCTLFWYIQRAQFIFAELL